MRRRVTGFAFLMLLAAAARVDGGEPKPWVRVKPDVMVAGSVVAEMTFDAKMPVGAPEGSVVEIEIPYHFGVPQTEDAGGDNYLSAKLPRKPRMELGLGEETSRAYVIQVVVKEGTLKKGKKLKVSLERERVHPFNHDDKTFLVSVKGPAGPGGERPVLAEGRSNVVHVPGGPPARLRVVAPTCVTPGEPFAAKIAVLDENNNPAGSAWTGEVSVAGEGVAGPTAAAFADSDANYLEIPGFAVFGEGVYRLNVDGGGLAGRSNPIVCRESWDRRIYWCDEQGHSAFSDGMRQPDEYFDYGRYVGLLDATLLTDHAENLYDDEWPTFVAVANAKNDPPAFVTLVAYEWTSDAWTGGYGHRCVFFRGDGGPYYSSFDEGTDTPGGLWAKYRPGEVVMIPHHTLAGFRWGNFDPAFDRCVEIVSHWGSSEYEGNPFWLRRAWRGGGVVDALASRYLLGFVGGGDNHNGAPGQNHGPSRMRHMPYYGGITACLIKENTRAAVFDALYERRVYATAGNRDFVDFSVNGAPMASVVPVAAGAPLVEAEVATEDKIKSVEVVRNGATVYAAPAAAGDDYLKFAWRDEEYDGSPGYYYLRVTSADGHLAFATPVWVARGSWFAAGPEESGALTPGRALALPEPSFRDDGNFAVRLAGTAAAPGKIRITSGGEVVAAADAAEGEQELTVFFKAPPGEWDVRLAYDGAAPFALREGCVFPYPWREPKWVGRWWTWQTEDEGAMQHEGSVAVDASASGGQALKISPADNLYETVVLWGPYQILERGRYEAHFYLRAEGNPASAKPCVEISVATAPAGTYEVPNTTAARTISVGALAGADGYQKYTLDFELVNNMKCEYKVKYLGGAIVYVDKVDVQQIDYE
jgi:hypothetical protein